MKRQTTSSDSVSSTNHVHSLNTDTTDNEKSTLMETDSNSRLPLPTIGARITAMYQGARRPGTVLTVNDKRGIFKMRFDEFPTAEFDYSFSYKSPAWSYLTTVPSSSTTTETANTTEDEPLFTIARKFKALIKVHIFFFIRVTNVLIKNEFSPFLSLCYHPIGN